MKLNAMANQLHVLRLTPHFFRPEIWPVAYDPVGGLQTQVWRLAGELDKARIRQTVLTSHVPGSSRRMNPFPSTEVLCVGAAVPERLAGVSLNFSWFLGTAWHLLRNAGNYDLVHIHYNHSVWCRVLASMSARLKTPTVVTLNTALWGRMQAAIEKFDSRLNFVRWVERWSLARADVIVALTEWDSARQSQALGLKKEQFAVVPDGIDAAAFSVPLNTEDVERFRRAHGIPDRKSVVGYVGRISDEKGSADLPYLVRKLTEAGNFVLICGDGPDRANLEAKLQTAGLEFSCKITGFLAPSEVRTALGITQVLIVPSRREAFGSVLLEAMAAGVPAVAYGVGGIVEVAGAPNAISLIEPGNADAFVRRVAELLSDARERADQAGRGHDRVGNFDIKTSAEKVLSLYRKLPSERLCGYSPARSGNGEPDLSTS